MPSYLFQALLLLFSVFFCALCGAGSADLVVSSVGLFKRGPIDVFQPKGDNEESMTVARVLPSFFVGIGGVMVALVGVERTDGTYDILTKYICTEGDNWGYRAIEDGGRNWKAQLAWKSEKTTHIAFAPVARSNSVYVLSASNADSVSLSPEQNNNTKTWDLKLTVGRITYGANAAVKKIKWNTKNVSDRFLTDISQSLKDVSPFDGSALLMDDGTLVFVVRAINFTCSKFVFVIAHSRNPNNYFTFTYVNTTTGCYSNFFSLGEQLFLVPKYCYGDNSSSNHKLQASNDMGETWGEATGPLAERLNNMKGGKNSFTSITIKRRRVLLFTKERSESAALLRNVNISLFMADENHVERVGPIVTNVLNFFYGSFVYTNDELFFSRMRYGNFNTILMRLQKQLEKIKQLLKTWYPDDT